MVEIEGDEDEEERSTEEDIEMEVEDKNGQECRDEHGTRDEEEPSDVAGVLHDSRHDQTNDCLQKYDHHINCIALYHMQSKCTKR